MKSRALILAGIGLLLAAATTAGVARDIYIYQEGDGTRWFTNKRIHDRGFKLIGVHGRPTATASCAGMTPQRLTDRAQPLLPLIERYADEYRLDARLVHAVITVESCFDTQAVSTAGARGLMQLMPATASEVGVRDVFNPGENIRGGAHYLSKMLARFGSDLELALAAYNAGPGAVERYGGIPPYPETRNYVTRVLDHYARNGRGIP